MYKEHTSPHAEKTYIISVGTAPATPWENRHSLNELKDLAATLNLEVAGEFTQFRSSPDPHSYIGRGKLEEISHNLSGNGASLVLFNNNLSPRQSLHVERSLGCMVWDRTQIILEIFARHACTAEAKVQVELAMLKYMLPRLVGMWAHLDRERGGISASRGTGEKQINIDRQIIRNRIARLEKRLEKISAEKRTQKKRRKACFQAALVGYTNAGKSTLMNLLTKSAIAAEDKLFATLDATTRRLNIAGGFHDILISDTVGFISNLPHHLVASFRSTLDVVRDADLLIHVVDAAHPDREQHIATTVSVLEEIGAADVPRLLVCNKSDLLTDAVDGLIIEKKHAPCIMLSAMHPDAGAALSGRIADFFEKQSTTQTIKVPYSSCERIAHLYEQGSVGKVEYRDDAVYVKLSRCVASS
jgi:GTP-binding protein HflX